MKKIAVQNSEVTLGKNASPPTLSVSASESRDELVTSPEHLASESASLDGSSEHIHSTERHESDECQSTCCKDNCQPFQPSGKQKFHVSQKMVVISWSVGTRLILG